MILSINEKNEILSYVEIGGIEGGLEYTGELPDGFRNNFKPRYYLLSNGLIEVNPDYSEPTTEETKPALTQQDVINAQFLKTILDLKLELKELKANG